MFCAYACVGEEEKEHVFSAYCLRSGPVVRRDLDDRCTRGFFSARFDGCPSEVE